MPGKVTLYHTNEHGETVEVEMYQVDANDALKKHPDEYSRTPPKGGTVISGATGEEIEQPKRKKSGADAVASEVVTERAGPTRRDPPVTDGALSVTNNPVTPQPVTEHDNLGEGGAEATSVDRMSNTDLRKYIEGKTGKRPANFVQRDQLLEQARGLAGGAEQPTG